MKYHLAIIYLLIAAISAFVFTSQQKKKIAFIRSGVLLEKYKGIQEAKGYLDSRYNEWQSRIDTLSNSISQSEENFRKDSPSLSPNEKQQRLALLEVQKKQLDEYRKLADAKLEEENMKMAQGSLNQINSFVKDYAKAKGYELVFGVTSGNILYGEDALDITEQVLDELNKTYAKK